jgi:hypothetical protein
VIRAALILAGLIVGWVAFVLGACVAFIAADTWVARKYRRNPNGPGLFLENDDTGEWLVPDEWTEMHGD